MVHYFNIFLQSNWNLVMNVHEFMNPTTIFTLIICSFADFLLNSCPSIAVLFLAISTSPVRIVFPVKSVLCPPSRRTSVGAKVPFLCFKISRRTFKCFLTPCADFFSSVSWACASCWALIVAFPRAVFTLIANKAIKFFITNNANCLMGSFVIFPTHVGIITHDIEIDKEYYDAAVKRLDNHKKQGQLFI